MLTLKEYKSIVDPLMKLENQLKTKLRKIEKKLSKFREDKVFICNKCKNVYSKKELGYRKYLTRFIDTRFLGMGDRECQQKEILEHVLCCPKCGKTFDTVIHKEVTYTSPIYDPSDKKLELKYPLTFKKLISKEIFKQ